MGRAKKARKERELQRGKQRALERLLMSLRTFVPGTSVLFAFLIAVPFKSGFVKMSILDQRVYYATFVLSAIATALLIAPSVQQRVHWQIRKNFGSRTVPLNVLLMTANIGTLLMGLVIVLSVYLISDFILSFPVATTVMIVTAVFAATCWYLLPLMVERRHRFKADDAVTPLRPDPAATAGEAGDGRSKKTDGDRAEDDLEERQQLALRHLLQGLRTSIPAAGIMFAFMLTLPFQSNFALVTQSHNSVAFYATFITAAFAIVLMTAPSVQERAHWLWYKNFGARLLALDVALWSANVGTALLGLSIVGGVYLVSDVLFGPAASVPTAVGVAVVLLIGWAVLPIRIARRREPEFADAAASLNPPLLDDPAGRGPSASAVETHTREMSEQELENHQQMALQRLLEGLRTFVPGTTVIFAFLLALPFQSGFSEIGAKDIGVFYVSFVAAAFATVFLVAPSAHERSHWMRRRNFGTRTLALDFALWTAHIGTVLMGITVMAAVYLVTSVVFRNNTLELAVVVAVGATTVATWLTLPLWIEGRRNPGFRDAVTPLRAPPPSAVPASTDTSTKHGPGTKSQPSLEVSQQLALRQLLAGLRTFLPAAGIMFAFLLALPFQSGFAKISMADNIVFYVTFISSALAMILLVAPSAQERIHWARWGSFSSHSLALDVALWSANAGTVLASVTIAASVYLVSSVVYDLPVAIVASCGLVAVALFIWTWLPSWLEKRRASELSDTATPIRPDPLVASGAPTATHVATAHMTPHFKRGRRKAAKLEDKQQRALQQLNEGLQTFIPATTVLFAFFVSLTSQSRFDKVASHTVAFFIAFTTSAFATIMLTAPTVHERIHWLRFGNFGARTLALGMALAIANIGTLLMGIAISASVYLVTAVMFGVSSAIAALSGTALVAISSWLTIPTWIEWRREGHAA